MGSGSCLASGRRGRNVSSAAMALAVSATNTTCRIVAVVHVRVNSRIQLVRYIGGMRAGRGGGSIVAVARTRLTMSSGAMSLTISSSPVSLTVSGVSMSLTIAATNTTCRIVAMVRVGVDSGIKLVRYVGGVRAGCAAGGVVAILARGESTGVSASVSTMGGCIVSGRATVAMG